MESTVDTKTFDIKSTISKYPLVGLWKLSSGFRLPFFLATFSIGVAATLRTGNYLLIGYFIDEVLDGEQFSKIIPLVAIGFVILALLQGVFTFLSGKYAAQTSEGITKRLRNYFYDHIQRLSFAYHDKTKTGELIQRSTSDVDAIRRFFGDQAIGLGRILLLFTINLGVLISLNVKLALFSVIVVPITVVLSYFFFKQVSKAYEAYQEQDAILSNTLQENLAGVRVVKAFARQSYERQKFEVVNWEKFLRGRRLLVMHSLFWPISDILTGFQMLAGFYLGATMAIDGIISIGTYLSYVGMLIWIIWPIRNLGRLIVQMSTGLVSYKRIMDIVQVDREDLSSGRTPQDEIKIDIEFKDVSFEFESGKPVLKNITFTCKQGEVIALLGSTGSGKTALINLLPRFYDYTSGLVSLDGVDLKEYPRNYLRGLIGTVEQEPFLFSRTIKENITYGIDRQISDEEIEAAAKAAAIHDVILSFSDGYDTLVGEKGVTLSGGQRQRVAIARTLIKNPRILMLDDATSSVDLETESEIHDALDKLMAGRTTFIIAHRVQSLMNADKILVMDKGSIVQQGSHKQLIKETGFYQRIFNIQTQIEDELEEEIAEAFTSA